MLRGWELLARNNSGSKLIVYQPPGALFWRAEKEAGMPRIFAARLCSLALVLPVSVLLSSCGWQSLQGTRVTVNCPSWQMMSSQNPGNVGNQLSDLIALANNNIWAVGGVSDTSTATESRNLIEHWDGTRWSVVASQKPGFEESDYPDSLLRISGSSASDLWAVGDGEEGFLEHWDGSSWQAVANPAQPRTVYSYHFMSVAALSSTDAWAVGQTLLLASPTMRGNGEVALIAHWDGKSWSIVSNPDLHADLNGTQLDDIAALAPDNVWAVGSTSSVEQGQLALIEHWDGKSWSVVASPQPQGSADVNSALLWSLDALSPSDIWAGGFYELSGVEHYLLEHWDGHAWKLVPIPLQAKKWTILHQVLALSDSNIWALDAESTLLHWDGKSWSRSALPEAEQHGYTISRMAALPNGQLWLAGTVNDPLSSGPKTLLARSCS